MLLETVKKRPEFKLKEFLHAQESIVKKDTENYTNQIVVSFYNEQKLNHATSKND